MKILFGSVAFYSPNISGVGISTYLLASYLQSKGHQVFVVTSSDKAINYNEKDITGTVSILRLKAIRNPFRKGFYVPYMPKKRISEIVEEIKPDIIHVQDPMPMNMALQKEARKHGIPIMVTNHFLIEYVLAYLPKPTRPLFKVAITKKLVKFYNSCDAVTCPTQTIVDVLKKAGVTVPMYALSNGVDINRFTATAPVEEVRKNYGIPSGKTIILCLGRLDKDKSVHVLMEAIPKVLAKVDAHFVIAGWGDLYAKLNDQLKKDGLEKQVTTTGAVAYETDNLVALYQMADIFAIPSTIETQSIVTMEAMASGKPVVAAKAGALPELVKHAENGFLFKPGDPNDLATHLISLVKDEKMRQKMSQKSKELVDAHNLPKSLDKFETLYRDYIAKAAK